jgi:hypothetical protein
MLLILSRYSATNIVISNSEGLHLYEIETPLSLFEWKTTVSKIARNDSWLDAAFIWRAEDGFRRGLEI